MIALLLTGLVAFSVPHTSAGRVTWNGVSHAVDKLPAEMPLPAKVAIDQWSAWAVKHGYRLTLGPDGRVLFVSATSVTAQMELAQRTLTFFDEHLPAPPREKIAARPLSAGGGRGGGIPEDPDDVIPEDPEDEHSGSESLERALYGWSEQWGAGSQELDRDTITLMVIDGESDYSDAIDHLATLAPYLEEWTENARENLGFVLEKPMCGAWVLGGEGQEEWSPDAELVHRLSELLLARRFGRQPYWLSQGWAWYAETELRGAIYCYPYRNEFVYVVEHTAWPHDVKKLAAELGEFDIEMIASLVRGEWNGRAARFAFGAVAYLASAHADALPRVLEELRLAWDEGNRTDLGGGDWRRDQKWEVPLAEQIEILRAHTGSDVLAKFVESLRDD